LKIPTNCRAQQLAQQRAIDEHSENALRNLNIDAGSMRARRIIDDMVASETRTAAA